MALASTRVVGSNKSSSDSYARSSRSASRRRSESWLQTLSRNWIRSANSENSNAWRKMGLSSFNSTIAVPFCRACLRGHRAVLHFMRRLSPVRLKTCGLFSQMAEYLRRAAGEPRMNIRKGKNPHKTGTGPD